VKIREKIVDDTLIGYEFRCPACKELHIYYTSGRVAWQFNGDAERPTFTPSLRNTWDNAEENLHECCHMNLTDGVILYHGDCTHSMAGQSVELPHILGTQ
jgi:hypothetical protein